jgi:hypothetical protein
MVISADILDIPDCIVKFFEVLCGLCCVFFWRGFAFSLSGDMGHYVSFHFVPPISVHQKEQNHVSRDGQKAGAILRARKH